MQGESRALADAAEADGRGEPQWEAGGRGRCTVSGSGYVRIGCNESQASGRPGTRGRRGVARWIAVQGGLRARRAGRPSEAFCESLWGNLELGDGPSARQGAVLDWSRKRRASEGLPGRDPRAWTVSNPWRCATSRPPARYLGLEDDGTLLLMVVARADDVTHGNGRGRRVGADRGRGAVLSDAPSPTPGTRRGRAGARR